ncbi:MAG: class I SAM-dependent methyltransferase [Gammaproteobacteria bacterium]|nr:class I SAM-dependent methyltransferase [Gammaproteobacteria bacterium]MBU1624178.1 class I SAM-dependent methyltransferase [Gammaproteobacteria bacterium]MBU1981906.1 class I SAM-dependent methyltransferase [Gammaproteobacteria bacterium]
MTTPHQPYRQNPFLRTSYTLIAPLYDFVIEAPMRAARKHSLAALPAMAGQNVLVSGAGTGLDLPHLPTMHRYTALDFNADMLARARPRGAHLDIDFILGDSMALPFDDAQFDVVVLHLIVAVVPEPHRALSEAARVLKPGGKILLFDKFLQPGQRAPVRRLLNGLSRRMATRMDVVFEEVLSQVPQLMVESDVPALGGGWFRKIILNKY